MISNVSFGQIANMPQEQTKITQQANYVVSNQQADSYVSSKKKKSHPIAKLLVAAAAVLGGSVLATKSGKFSEAADKVAKASKAATENAEKISLKDKAMSAIYNLGNKVKGIFVKPKKEIPLPPIGLPTPEQVDKTIAKMNKTGQVAEVVNKAAEKSVTGQVSEAILGTAKKAPAKEKLPTDATKAMNKDMKKAVTEKTGMLKAKVQVKIEKIKDFVKGKKNVDEVVEDASTMSKKAQKRVKARRAADEVKNWKTHNPKKAILAGDGKAELPSLPIGLPTPEQVDKTIAEEMKKVPKEYVKAIYKDSFK